MSINLTQRHNIKAVSIEINDTLIKYGDGFKIGQAGANIMKLF